jgi:hypothetical protein
MTKKELVQILSKLDDNDEVYIHVAYNTYAIRQIINWGDFAVIPEPHHFDDTDIA